MLEPIYVDRLEGGSQTTIDCMLPADFMEVNEAELAFKKTILVKGRAYASGDHLIVHFDATAYAIMPCSICNQDVEVKIQLNKYIHTIPLEEIKGAVYNGGPALREALLLEVPRLAECGGQCPKRKQLQPFLKADGDETHFPFAELDKD